MGYVTGEFLKAQFDNFANRVGEVFPEKKEVENLISGAQTKALVFDTKEDLDAWLENEENVSELKTGQNIYIKAEDTPDYWWDGTEPQPLETEKVDLEGYVTESQLNTALSGYVKATDVETENIDFSTYFSGSDEV